MKKHFVIILWIAIIAIFIFATSSGCGSDKVKEGFYNYYGYYKRYCPSAGWRSRSSCAKCTNAGWCVNASGYGQCVPGDSSGPYFTSDCVYWEYGDPYYYAPMSHIYPIVSTRSIYPYHRWRLRRPYRWRHPRRYMKTKSGKNIKKMKK